MVMNRDVVVLSDDQFNKLVELLTPGYEMAKAYQAQMGEQRDRAAAYEQEQRAAAHTRQVVEGEREKQLQDGNTRPAPVIPGDTSSTGEPIPELDLSNAAPKKPVVRKSAPAPEFDGDDGVG